MNARGRADKSRAPDDVTGAVKGVLWGKAQTKLWA